MLFPFLTQKIANYLNMDGKLDGRKGIFCILNMTASGGILGLFLLAVLAISHNLNRGMLLLELMVVAAGSAGESLMAFHNVERQSKKSKLPAKSFVLLCMLPMMLYLLGTLILMLL